MSTFLNDQSCVFRSSIDSRVERPQGRYFRPLKALYRSLHPSRAHLAIIRKSAYRTDLGLGVKINHVNNSSMVQAGFMRLSPPTVTALAYDNL